MDVREKAVSYLNSRPRTRQELIRHLKDKGFSENEILETVDELEQYHYIDDLAYSRMYFEYGFQKGRGRMRIRRELAEKGVAADVIEIAFGTKAVKVKVTSVQDAIRKEDAKEMFEYL